MQNVFGVFSFESIFAFHNVEIHVHAKICDDLVMTRSSTLTTRSSTLSTPDSPTAGYPALMRGGGGYAARIGGASLCQPLSVLNYTSATPIKIKNNKQKQKTKNKINKMNKCKKVKSKNIENISNKAFN